MSRPNSTIINIKKIVKRLINKKMAALMMQNLGINDREERLKRYRKSINA